MSSQRTYFCLTPFKPSFDSPLLSTRAKSMVRLSFRETEINLTPDPEVYPCTYEDLSERCAGGVVGDNPGL